MITAIIAASSADADKAAPFGLFLVLIIGVAIFFLGKSMRKHMDRVPKTFDVPEKDVADQVNADPKSDQETPS